MFCCCCFFFTKNNHISPHFKHRKEESIRMNRVNDGTSANIDHVFEQKQKKRKSKQNENVFVTIP